MKKQVLDLIEARIDHLNEYAKKLMNYFEEKKMLQILKRYKIKPENRYLLADQGVRNKDILDKFLVWQEDYTDIEWEDFKEHYFKCSRCGIYLNDQCICYAR